MENIEKQLREFTSKKKTRPFFPWKLYFAEVFEKDGFDIVIGNPPYGYRDVLTKEEKEALLARATKKAIKELHHEGRPATFQDEKGICQLYPDGHKEYI